MNKKEWILKEATELRCETSGSDYLVVKILDGCGEIFGAEMANNIEYCFYERNIAIFSWYGCRLETYGVCQTIYISEDTPMSVYVNAHAQLELRRDVALSNNDAGPRVLIMGPSDHGKSSVSKILCNYALRLDRNPIYVDLDVSSGLLSHVPGCLTAIPLDRSCITVEVSIYIVRLLVLFGRYLICLFHRIPSPLQPPPIPLCWHTITAILPRQKTITLLFRCFPLRYPPVYWLGNLETQLPMHQGSLLTPADGWLTCVCRDPLKANCSMKR